MNKMFQTFLISLTFLFMQNQVFAQILPPTNLTATEINMMNQKAVKLVWQGNNQSERYNVYKKHGALNDPGDFIRIANKIMMRSFVDRFVFSDSTYSYYVTAVVQMNESAPSNVAEITISGGQDLGVITGTLYSDADNQPIPNGKVSFISNSSIMGITVFTDQNGEFRANLVPGSYYMRSMAMNFIPEFYDNVQTIQQATLITLNSGDSLNFNIGLAPFVPATLYQLSGNVTDTNGNPLRARIVVLPIRHNTYFNRERMRWVLTDSLGNYSAPVKDGDTVVVYCQPFDRNYLPEYFDDKQTFAEADRIPVNGNVTGIDFIIEPVPVYNNGIAGVVQNENNEAVIANVHAFNMNMNPPYSMVKKYRTLTDSLGNYSFTNMKPGEYILLAIPHEGYMPTFFRYDGQQTLSRWEADSVIVEENGIVTGINFIVRPFNSNGYASITGSAKDVSDNSLNAVIVFALNKNNEVVSYAITNSEGQFILNDLEPGTYKIMSDKIGYSQNEFVSVTLDYISNLTQSVQITLTPEGLTSNNDEYVISDFRLSQNYPNPFNPSTKISWQSPVSSWQTLKVYDVLGNEVVTLVDEYKPAGAYTIEFNAQNLSSGIYFYTLQAGDYFAGKKMILIK